MNNPNCIIDREGILVFVVVFSSCVKTLTIIHDCRNGQITHALIFWLFISERRNCLNGVLVEPNWAN